jgi:hypothetical protein
MVGMGEARPRAIDDVVEKVAPFLEEETVS